MASKKPDLMGRFRKDQFSGVLSRLTDGQFNSLLNVLSTTVKAETGEIEETVGRILAAVDSNPHKITDAFPKELSLEMMEFARQGKINRRCYREIRAWYATMEKDGVDLAKKVKKKKGGEPKPDAKPTVKAQPTPSPKVKADPEPHQDARPAAKVDDADKLTVADLIKDIKVPPPVKGKEPEPVKAAPKGSGKQKPKPQAKGKPEPKPKPATQPQSAAAVAASNGLLAISHQNTQIYNLTHETSPDLFFRFDPEALGVNFGTNPECFEIGEGGKPEPLYISRRVLDAAWRTRHPVNNPLSDKSLGPVIDFLMDRWVNYDMLLRFIDNMDYTQIVYTARRVWWMMRYNEFLRFSLVKEALVSDKGLHFRLVQRWFNHPLVKYVTDQWLETNKK